MLAVISLVGLIVVIALVGLVVWLVSQIEAIPPKFQRLIQVAAIVFLVLWILDRTGLFHSGVRLR